MWARCKRTQTRREAAAELWEAAEVPWTVRGERAPRRLFGEETSTYVRRRVRWAAGRYLEAYALAGDASAPSENLERLNRWRFGWRSLARLEADFPELDPRDVQQYACVPWLVVDIRAERGRSAFELVKYTVKTEGAAAVRPVMLARVWAAMRRRHRFERSEAPELTEETPRRCPNCGSEDCRIAPREHVPDVDRPTLADLADEAWRIGSEFLLARGRAPPLVPAVAA
jgi:hypothetical protein